MKRRTIVARAGAALAVICGLAMAADVGAAPQDAETAKRLLAEATEQEREGELEGALRDYELLVERFGDQPAAAEALLRMVAAYRALDRAGDAETAAEQLIASHPAAPQAAGAHVARGELLAARAGDPAALEEARMAFESAVKLFPRGRYPRLEWRAAGATRAAELALELGLDAEAARLLVEVVDHEPPSAWTARARLEMAGLLLDLDRWPEAADLLQEVVDGPAGGDAGPEAVMMAQSRLDLIDRFWLRPGAGQPRWQTARLVGAAPDKPNGVAAHDDGRVAVIGGGGSTVVLDAAGATIARWSVEEAARISWRGDSVLVATKERAVELPDRRVLSFAAPPDEKKHTLMPLEAVERAAFGGWLVLAGKPERAMLYGASQRRGETLVGGKGSEPIDIARDRRGRLLVLDRRARAVFRFAADGGGRRRLAGGDWRQAQALAVDAVGRVYVLDRDGRIEVLDRNGERIDSLGLALPGGLELKRPLDLSVDGAGRLWIADARQGLVVVE